MTTYDPDLNLSRAICALEAHEKSMTKTKHQCAEMVWGTRSWATHETQCSRQGKIEEDGKFWCRQHAPSTIAKKRELVCKRRGQKQAAHEARCGLKAAQQELVETVCACADSNCGVLGLCRAVSHYRAALKRARELA